MKKKCTILNIGTELLVGHVLNTNANYLSKLMNSLGYNVYYHISCGDNFERSFDALDFAIKFSDLVIITGGLGPTEDDITRDIVAKYFGVELYLDKEIEQDIRDMFKKFNLDMTSNNFKQAYYPMNAIPLKNKRGTAAGFVYESDECTVVALPGPPSEMSEMAENEMRKYISGTGETLFSKYIKLSGISESRVDEIINDIFVDQKNPTIGIYSDSFLITLRLSTMCKTQEEADALFSPVEKIIISRLGEYVFSTDGKSLVETVVKLLEQKCLKISFAESCTGGLLASSLTSVSGASKVFDSSFVTYSIDEKVRLLGVDRAVIDKYGVISKECAREMTTSLYNKTMADIVVSVTGVAGPTGPTGILDDYRVGEVYIGYRINSEVYTVEKKYNGSRDRIRNYILRDVFFELFKSLSKN